MSKINDSHYPFIKFAYDYLVKLYKDAVGKEESSLQRYFEIEPCNSVNDLFRRFVRGTQETSRMAGVIDFKKREPVIAQVLDGYNLRKIKGCNVESLYNDFKKQVKINKSENPEKSCWWKWCRSIIDSAKYLSGFGSKDSFFSYVNQHNENVPSRIFCAYKIQSEIFGMGFPLACNILKDLGYVYYSKPDVHILDVLEQLEICKRDQFLAFECVHEISRECMKYDKSLTPYKVDRVIWLICSGDFFLDDTAKRFPRKEEFIEAAKECFK